MGTRDNPDLGDVRKALVIRTDKIGDMILSTPAMRNIREGLPSARITLVASPYNAPIARDLGYVDEVLEYDRNWPLPARKGFARKLRDARFDLCVILSPSTESYRIAHWSRAKTRAGIIYSRRIMSRIMAPVRLTHSLVMKLDGAVERGERVPHEVEQMLQLLNLIGLPAKDYPSEVHVNQSDVEWARDVASSRCSGQTVIGVHLSDKWFESGWTGLGMALLFDEILRTIPDSSIIATYGPADAVAAACVAPYVESESGHDLAESLKGRLLMAGNLSFGRWAGLTSICRAVLTRDTGSLHLAAALGRPVVAIYEKGSFKHNSQQWGPWKVPHYCMESGDFSETSSEILRKLVSLLAETDKKAA